MPNPIPPYELIYWPGAPGRAEVIRLFFEETGTPYHDTAKDLPPEEATELVLRLGYSETDLGDEGNPPSFASPILRHGQHFVSQTANILLFLADKIPGLNGCDPGDVYRLNALTLTMLERLLDEVHNTHHTISGQLYYEDQKAECLRAAKIYVDMRLPKHLGYFERVLQSEGSGEGPWLWAGKITWPDLVLFHCLEGTQHAFPTAMKAARASGKYERVFNLHKAVQERPNIAAYLSSGRRQKFGMSTYRYYPELDITPSWA